MKVKKFAAACGMCLMIQAACARKANAIRVDSLTATGGSIVNNVLTLPSGQSYIVTAQSNTSNLSDCARVWIAREGSEPFVPTEVRITNKSSSQVSFEVYPRTGDEGTYDVYLCEETRPEAANRGNYQTRYRVVAPTPPAPVELPKVLSPPLTTEARPPASSAPAPSARKAPARPTSRTARTARTPSQLVRIATLERQVKELQGLRIQMATQMERQQGELGKKADKQDVVNVVNQVQAVNRETERLASDYQNVQNRLALVDRELNDLKQRLQTGDTRMQQHEERIGGISQGVATLASDLHERKVGGRVLWFIPARPLKREQMYEVQRQVRRGQPTLPPATYQLPDPEPRSRR